jgi:hypothetical protein
MGSKLSKRLSSYAGVSALALTLGLVVVAVPGQAEAAPSVAKLEEQIQQLQAELEELKAAQSAQMTAAQQAQQEEIDQIVANEVKASKKLSTVAPAKGASVVTYDKKKGLKLGALTVKIGGFLAAEAVVRDKNETSDIGSTFGGSVPFRNSPNYHQSEYRGTARQSRLSLMLSGDPDKNTHLTGYYEGDFLGAASSANSKESNSYTPRIRQVWAAYERSDLGFHLYAGQTWTLATLEKKGMLPLDENAPLTIDASYVPGFTYLRNPEFRVVKDFGKKYWLGAALDNPQTIAGGTAPAAVENLANAGNFGFAPAATGVTYTNNVAPDITIKGAADTKFGHFEVFGLGRFFEDRTTYPVAASHQNYVTMGGGFGAGAIVPVIPKKLDVQLSGLWGYGTGRYGSTQLPDVTYHPDGSLVPLENVQALLGLIGHVTPLLDVYGYVGMEQVHGAGVAGSGYGSGLGGSTAGCYVEGGACAQNYHRISQGTIGEWWKVYKGPAGTLQWGLQYELTRFDAYRGTGSLSNPHTMSNQVYASFRYYPFQ